MKVSEILNSDPINTVEVLEGRLSRFDWEYDLVDDVTYIQSGALALESLERQMYEMWKQNPIAALSLWKKHCPWASRDYEGIPSFIPHGGVQNAKKPA